MIRGFEEQFGAKKVVKIRSLLERIEAFTLPRGVNRYYAVDLSMCLQAGALLGALHVAASLLEIIVREIVIERTTDAVPESNRTKINLQSKLEEKRNFGFKQLVQELKKVGLFDSNDAELARQFYDDVRIPIHHGLPARFVRNNDDFASWIEELLGLTSMHAFEEVIEDNAISLIETAVGIIERNSR